VSHAEATKEPILVPALASACQDKMFADLRSVVRRVGEAQFRTSGVAEPYRRNCRYGATVGTHEVAMRNVRGRLNAVKDPCSSLPAYVVLSTTYRYNSSIICVSHG